jgi:UDP:flavonoid glycosyltransferase YjiC (YdhE family)
MGDTQPFVSLAVRLKQQGHTVKLAARPDFATLAASYDIEFFPLGNPYKSLLRNEEVATAIGSGNMLKMIIKQASDSKQRKAFFDRLDTAMRKCASDIGEQIRSEDGVGTTVNLFERFVQQEP